jgi:metallopeptidase MepB
VRDFVEIPSKMLENWCWMPSQIRDLSHHYSYLSPEYLTAWNQTSDSDAQPPQKIPDDLAMSITNTRYINSALSTLKQLFFSIYDMTIHEPANHDAVENMNFSEIYNKLWTEITMIDGPEALGDGYEWGNGQAKFRHLVGDYDAGYYCYPL